MNAHTVSRLTQDASVSAHRGYCTEEAPGMGWLGINGQLAFRGRTARNDRCVAVADTSRSPLPFTGMSAKTPLPGSKNPLKSSPPNSDASSHQS